MTKEDLQNWRDSEGTITVREKYRRRYAALTDEIIELATKPGPLDDQIHAKAGAAIQLRSVIRDLTEGDTL